MTQQYSKSAINAENRLLRQLFQVAPEICFGDDYAVELQDVHFHVPEFNASVPLHAHSIVEIHTVLSGAGKLHVGKHSWSFGAGQFTVTGPGLTHHWTAVKKPLLMRVWHISFPDDTASNNGTGALFAGLREPRDIVYDLPEGFDERFAGVLSELSGRQAGYEHVVGACLRELLVMLARVTLRERLTRTRQTDAAVEADRIVRLVDQFLLDNMAVPVGLEAVAKHVSRSKRCLTRHYKAVTGVTVGQRLHQIRMERASVMLARNHDMPIKAIAQQCGIPDVSYFSRQFKDVYKYPPSEYRRRFIT